MPKISTSTSSGGYISVFADAVGLLWRADRTPGELAELMESKPEVVSRYIAALIAEGVVEVKGKRKNSLFSKGATIYGWVRT